jgi:2-keto-4-pentenoate hydratase/2-oxohepta-3-ene-1,7-dioic acid hydratase in catechol pathway
LPNPQNLPVKFSLNGKLTQDATTSLMIHDVFELVSYGSNIMTLRADDVIATGTPSGVGSARQPPIYLNQRNKVQRYLGASVSRCVVVSNIYRSGTRW